MESLVLSVILRSFRLTKAGFVYIIIIVNMAVIREYCWGSFQRVCTFGESAAVEPAGNKDLELSDQDVSFTLRRDLKHSH